MLQPVFDALTSGYNVLLFALAIWGAGRFGIFVIGRSWHWVAKAIVIVIVAASIEAFLVYATGGPKTDLRIVTELCATAGAIFAVEWAFRHVTDVRGRIGLIAVLGVFLFVTWGESIDQVRGGVPSVVGSPVSVSAPEPDVQQIAPRKSICDEDISSYQRKQIGCPPK